MFFRSVIGAGMIAGSMLVATAATAAADPPNCTAADLAGVMSGVNAAHLELSVHPSRRERLLHRPQRQDQGRDEHGSRSVRSGKPTGERRATGCQAARRRLP